MVWLEIKKKKKNQNRYPYTDQRGEFVFFEKITYFDGVGRENGRRHCHEELLEIRCAPYQFINVRRCKYRCWYLGASCLFIPRFIIVYG